MKRLGLTLLALLPFVAAATPVLIVQSVKRDAKTADVLIDRQLAYFLAEELQTTFVFQPVVWSMTDPIFRQGIYDGILKGDAEKPTMDDARNALKPLRAEFLFWIETDFSNSGRISTLRVFKGESGRPLYERKLDMGATLGGTNAPDLLEHSTARTWVLDLAKEKFETYRRGGTETLRPADNGVVYTPEPPVEPAASQEATLTEVEGLVAKGQMMQAREVLYQAIDRAPLSMELRRRLVIMLGEMGEREQAAQEATRALALKPDDLDLRLAVTEGALAEGNYDQALNDVNEVLVRQPDHAQALLMAAEIALYRGDPASARAKFLSVMAKQPSFRAQLGLAVTVAAEGDLPEAERLISTLPNPPATGYDQLVKRLSGATKHFTAGLIKLLQQLRSSANRPALRPQAELALKQAEAFATLLEKSKLVPSDTKVADRRLLAHKLLTQSAGELLEFARTGDSEMADIAQLSLSDALKRLEELNSGPKADERTR